MNKRKIQAYPWKRAKPYNDYSGYIRQVYDVRVQKIAINAGFTCPNRDGSKGLGGCIYCNNQSFNPDYCLPEKNILTQINEGILFFSKKYKTQKYFAYFQAYTNTYAEFEILKARYDEALSHPKVVGLVIATRPDCVSEELLAYLKPLSKKYYIIIEFGVESCNDDTLRLINRGHDYQQVVEAVEQTRKYGIFSGAHMILGLPGETRETILSHAEKLSKLPLHTIKLHQLQIIKQTKLAKMFLDNPTIVHQYSVDEYLDLVVDFLERLKPSIIVERVAGEAQKEFILNKKWGLKNFEIIAKLEKRMIERQSFQGRLYNATPTKIMCSKKQQEL